MLEEGTSFVEFSAEFSSYDECIRFVNSTPSSFKYVICKEVSEE